MKRLFAVFVLCLLSCSTVPEAPPDYDVSTKVSNSAKTGQEAAADISESTDEVRRITSSGRNEAPQLSQWTNLDREVSSIEQANATISSQFGIMSDQADRINLLERSNRNSSQEIEKLEDKIAELKDKNNQWIFRTTLSLAAIGIATGIGLMFVPGMRRLGATVLAASTACAGVAKFFLQFPWVLPLIGGAIMLTILYMVWRNRKNVLDIVDFGENAAKGDPTSDEDMDVKVDTLRDKSTQKTVRDARKILKKRRENKPLQDLQ